VEPSAGLLFWKDLCGNPQNIIIGGTHFVAERENLGIKYLNRILTNLPSI
jgi:hypothetical protein